MMLNKVALVAAMTLTLLIGGCFTPTETGPNETPSANSAKPLEESTRDLSRAELNTPSPVTMPFAQYFSIARQAEASAADQWYLERSKTYAAVQAEVGRCMQSAGFKWFVDDLVKPAPEIPTGGKLSVPALPSNEMDVSAYGYGRWSPASDDSAEQSSGAAKELDSYLESLGDDGAIAFNQALFNDPGCGISLMEPETSQVDSSWYTDPINAMQQMFFGDKDGVGLGSLMSQPEMQALNSEWGSCMAGKGVLGPEDWRLDPDLSGPTNAFYIAVATGQDGSRAPTDDSSDLDADHSSLTGSAVEVAIAVADYSCRIQTDYINRFAALQVKAETDWVSSHQALLDQMVATWEQQEHK